MKTKKLGMAICALVTAGALAGCTTMSQNETTGTVLGGVAGAVAGSQFGKGSGNKAMTAIGAILGATVGREIGRAMDVTSRQRQEASFTQALETTPPGGQITWENPDNSGGPAHGSTTITRQGRNTNGRTCREFIQEVNIGGRSEQAYGIACRDANGDWQIQAS